MGKIKDAIKDSFSRKAPEPKAPPEPKAEVAASDPPPADPAVEKAKAEAHAAARERFERVSRQFLSGGCSRDELAAAQAALEGEQ